MEFNVVQDAVALQCDAVEFSPLFCACLLLPQWWLPDVTVFVDEIPKTSVGKFSKKDLRKQFEHVVVA